MTDRIDGIIDRVSDAEEYEKASWLLGNGVLTNFAVSVIDDTIKANVDFQGKAGVPAKVKRYTVGYCCKWCNDLVGTYTYPDVPDELWHRHQNCNCLIDYTPAGGGRLDRLKGRSKGKAWELIDSEELENRKAFTGVAADSTAPGILKTRQEIGTADDIALNESVTITKRDFFTDEVIETEYKTNKLTKDFIDSGADAKKRDLVFELGDISKPKYSDYEELVAVVKPYQKGVAGENNFFYNTIGQFEEVRRPKRPPDYRSLRRDGKVSSEYWYEDGYLIRGSDHWGANVASCDWFLDNQATNMGGSKQYGKIKWEDLTQKTELVFNDTNDAVIVSTFDNTIGKFPTRNKPIIKGFNDKNI